MHKKGNCTSPPRWHKQLVVPEHASVFIEACLDWWASEIRTPEHAAALVRTIIYIALTVPLKATTSLQHTIKRWLQRLDAEGGFGRVANESMAAALLHRRVSLQEEDVVQLCLLYTLLSACDNQLVVAAPSLDHHLQETVRSSGSVPFALPYTLSSAAAGHHLETLYDALCGIVLHAPAYRDPHPAFSSSSLAFGLHAWQQVLEAHPVPDAAFLSECTPPLVALVAGTPPPLCHMAQSLVAALATEQLSPGSAALRALLREFPSLALSVPAEEEEATAAWSDSQRSTLLFFDNSDHGWLQLQQVMSAGAKGVPSCLSWDLALRRAVILTAFSLHTDAPAGVLSLTLESASPGNLAKWCAVSLAACLSMSPGSFDAVRALGVVHGGTLAGVHPAQSSTGSDASDTDSMCSDEEHLATLGRGAYANSAASLPLGTSSVPLQLALDEHTARLVLMNSLFADIMGTSGDEDPPTLCSSEWFRLQPSGGEPPAAGTEAGPRPDACGAGQLRIPSWMGIPDMLLLFTSIDKARDGLAHSQLWAPPGAKAQSSNPEEATQKQLQAAAAAFDPLHASPPESPWPYLLDSSHLVCLHAEEERILAAARQAAAVPSHFATVDSATGLQPAELASVACRPTLHLAAAGDDAAVQVVFAALASAMAKAPATFAVLDTRVYIMPSAKPQAVCTLAEYIAFNDPWYRRFVYGPFRGDCGVMPCVPPGLAAVAPLQHSPAHSTGPLHLHAELLQAYIRSASARVPVVLWQVECWLADTEVGLPDGGRVVAEKERGSGLHEPPQGVVQSGKWYKSDPLAPPRRPANMIVPMTCYVELGMATAVSKAQSRTGGSHWGALKQLVQTGQSLTTPDLCVQACVRSTEASSGGGQAAVLQMPAQRYASLRLDNCPRVRHLAARAARAATVQAEVGGIATGDEREQGPTAHCESALGHGGDELREVAGGAVWAAEDGSCQDPSAPWLSMSSLPDASPVSSWLTQRVRSASRDSSAPPRFGEELQDLHDRHADCTVVNHVTLCPNSIAGSTTRAAGLLDITVDGVLFPGQFSCVRISPLVLEPEGGAATVQVMHCM